MREPTSASVYINVEEAARVLSVSVKTIRRLIADGDLRAYRCRKRNLRIKVEDLDSVMRLVPSAACWSESGDAGRRQSTSRK